MNRSLRATFCAAAILGWVFAACGTRIASQACPPGDVCLPSSMFMDSGGGDAGRGDGGRDLATMDSAIGAPPQSVESGAADAEPDGNDGAAGVGPDANGALLDARIPETGVPDAPSSDGTRPMQGADAASGDGPQPTQGADAGPVRAIGISAGTSHTCALLSDGSARCWGYNDLGQLGNGTTGPSTCVNNSVSVGCSTRPVSVSNLSGATDLSLGDYFTCARLMDGSVQCWGLNEYGELGIGTSTGPSTCLAGNQSLPCSTTPVSSPSITGAASVAVSDQEDACALMSDGTIRCWGLNGGQLGNGSDTGPSMCTIGNGMLSCAPTPVTVVNIGSAIAVDTASFHTCALLAGGSVGCWGGNTDGRLGNGTTTQSFVPVAVSNLTSATAITTGDAHSCALLSDHSVQCWGDNTDGQLGIGDPTGPGTSTCMLNAVNPPLAMPCATAPVSVLNLTNVVAISAGANHTCALLATGLVQCWGSNDSGQLGIGTTNGLSTCGTSSSSMGVSCATTPVPVANLAGVTAISAGASHTCAVLADGSVQCWGSNLFGQLGNGTTLNSPSPVSVTW